MLSAREVQHIAKLARIGLTDEEILRFQKDLGSILEYFDILREIDDSSITPRTAALPLQNIARQDIARAKDAQEGQHLLEMAPATKDGYLKVKSIL
ncbi:MAG TPA: Asp-tRNA(Asn)/Glu-tRNA(Gln) amidotransferase subunit GatC [Candidatus Paceibacterota bacterium]